MKKNFTLKLATLFLACTCGVSTTMAQDVYQLPNPDFELWEDGIKLDGKPAESSKKPIEEPVGWNSFGTGTGSAIGLANSFVKNWTKKGNRGTSENPNYYAILHAGLMSANGNMTTGIINANNATPTNYTNFNNTPLEYSEEENIGLGNFKQKFTGYPDAIKVLIKYIPVNTTEDNIAQISAWIHTDKGNFRDPNGQETDIAEKAVAHALINPTATEARSEWKEFIAPFDYSIGEEGNVPSYILISATTNKTPGGGTNKDSLYIDDMYFIYHSLLGDLKINNTSIDGFDENITTYNFEGKAPEISAIQAIKKGRGGLIDVTSRTTRAEDEVTTITVTVKGDDYSVNSENVTTYNLVYTFRNATNIEDADYGKSANIYAKNSNVYITDYKGNVSIYNINGTNILNRNIEGDSSFELLQGTYVVKINNKSTTIIVK